MLTVAIHLVFLAALLTGCGGSQSTASGQVVARVNGQEISIHQLNRLAGGEGGLDQVRRRELIEQLVQRELAIQQALAMKLDRRPEVMLRLEEARRDTLAAAWADQLVAGDPPIAENEAARYFAAHPGLFSERKLYRLRELTLPADAPQASEMETRLKNGQQADQIHAWLEGKHAPFSDRNIVRLAEQLPIEAVERLRQAPSGQAVAFRSPRGVTLYEVQSAETLPVDWRTAKPVILTYLATQSRNRALEREMKRLRGAAQVDYPPEKNGG